MNCNMPGSSVLHYLLDLLKFMSDEWVILFNHLCHHYLLLPSVIFSIRVFSSELALWIMWPKYWNFIFSIIPSNEYSGLISFRSDWFHLVTIQGTLKSLLQHHSSKASILGAHPSLQSNSHIHTWLPEKPSVQFSCSVTSDSLQPHGLQHTRPPCPSPTPRVYSNSCPLSQWCHSTISSSVILFSSHLQSFPASGSFQMSQFFASGGQSYEVSASASVLPLYIQDWFPLGWTAWLSLHFPRDSQESFTTPQFKSINFSVLSFLHSPSLTSIHDY